MNASYKVVLKICSLRSQNMTNDISFKNHKLFKSMKGISVLLVEYLSWILLQIKERKKAK